MEELTIKEYEKLIRDSEQLKIIKKLACDYTSNLDGIIRSMAREDKENGDDV